MSVSPAATMCSSCDHVVGTKAGISRSPATESVSTPLSSKLEGRTQLSAMSTAKRKVLLMGKSGSGKTSMRSVIFSNYTASDTSRLGATIDVEHSHVRFLGSLVLNLWDCGGQESFLENYVNAQKDTIFSNVAVLIYVFDVSSSEWEKDVKYFEECLEALRANSHDAGVWALVNKMDLVIGHEERRRKFLEKKEELTRRSRLIGDEEGKGVLRCFGTSIWDESLYKAWSSVIHTLIPNVNLITSHLTKVRDISLSTEVVLFEAQTFLVIAKSGSPLDCDETEFDEVERRGGVKWLDRQRFEKISEIVKKFRTTCSRLGESFESWECRLDSCSVALNAVTKNTYLMIVASDPRVEPAMLMYNIEQCRIHFAEIGTQTELKRKCGTCRTCKEIKYDVPNDNDASIRDWDAI